MMFVTYLFLTFLLILSPFVTMAETAGESPQQIWKVSDRRWTAEKERAFGKWVQENVTEDFFIRYRIPVDCADVPYAIRWIYARIAHLPAAATIRDNRLIGHWSTTWGRLPTHKKWYEDQRFRAALLFMLNETTTRTLPLDTYPVRIDPESITAGTVFFITESHSGIISRVIVDGSSAHPLQTWEATVPAKIQKLSEKSFLAPRPESTIYSGLVKFRWPILKDGHWQYLPRELHPFYSLEQYSSRFYEGGNDFIEAVAKRIDPKDYAPWDKMEKVLDNTTRFIEYRVPIALEGYRQCREGGCPEGSAQWEIYSTPGRDGMITLLMEHLHRIIESNRLNPELVKEKMEAIHFRVSEDQTVTFDHLYRNYPWLSSQPWDSIEARWGLRKCDMILSQMKSAKKSIGFIDRRYRQEDPEYARFSILQQIEILRRLQWEWDEAECEEPPQEAERIGEIRR